jgi:hypothetical protein
MPATAITGGGGVDDGLDGAIERCLAASGCPQCGARLRLQRILSRRTATAVISTHCDGCGAVANRVCFTGDLLAQLYQCLADPFTEGLPEGAAPVEVEDVAAMHDFLDQFDGDFLALFRSTRRP